MESVTVSIHSLDKNKYNRVVQKEGMLLDKVLRNIDLLRDRGYERIKINTVLTNKTKEDVKDIIDFAVNEGIPKVNIISLLTMNERDRNSFVYPGYYEKILDDKYESEIVTTTRKRYFVNKKTVVDMVWQYCMVGCDICRKDGFIRLSPDLKFSYCLLGGAEISVSEEVKMKDLIGIRDKFEDAVSLMGNPVSYKNER